VILPQYRSLSLILYNSNENERLAWLSQALSVVLHAAQLYIRETYKDKATQLQTQLCAKTGPDGG